jgi:hypothetical protein
MLGIRRQVVFDDYRLDMASARVGHSLDHDQGDMRQSLDFAERDFDRALNVVREDAIRLSSADAEVQSVFKISSLRFGSKVQKAIEELGVIKPDFKSTHESSKEDAKSNSDAQMKTEDEYANSVYQVLDAMASEVAAEFTNTSK